MIMASETLSAAQMADIARCNTKETLNDTCKCITHTMSQTMQSTLHPNFLRTRQRMKPIFVHTKPSQINPDSHGVSRGDTMLLQSDPQFCNVQNHDLQGLSPVSDLLVIRFESHSIGPMFCGVVPPSSGFTGKL